MTAEDSKAYGIIDEIISSRAQAEDGAALLPGEPSRLMEAEAEPSPAEKPEA